MSCTESGRHAHSACTHTHTKCMHTQPACINTKCPRTLHTLYPVNAYVWSAHSQAHLYHIARVQCASTVCVHRCRVHPDTESTHTWCMHTQSAPHKPICQHVCTQTCTYTQRAPRGYAGLIPLAHHCLPAAAVTRLALQHPNTCILPVVVMFSGVCFLGRTWWQMAAESRVAVNFPKRL